MHCTGISNADFRVTAEWQQRRTLRPELHESKRKYHELQLGLSPAAFPDTDLARTRASLTQTDFYKTAGKPVRSHPVLSRTQTSPLKGLNVFVGGDNEPYIHKSESLHPASHPVSSLSPQSGKSRHTKDAEHKNASQETQLVHVQHEDTLEGKVDLAKVVDIRRTIRRRYANRSNFRTIFNQWDRNSLGVIRPEDVHYMVNQLGIAVNKEEARVLVASANQSNSGALTLEEFLQLIFDDSDRLNVDLSSLKVATESSSKPQMTDTMLADLHELAVNEHSRNQQEQLKLYLQQHLSDLTGQLLKMDKSRSGAISLEAFYEVMNNLRVPQAVSSEKVWKLLYTDAGGKDEGLQYRDFMKHVEAFAPGEEAVRRFHIGESSVQHPLLAKRSISLQQLQRPAGPVILDPQRVPLNKAETILSKSRRICTVLKEKYPSEGDFKAALEAKAAGTIVSQEQLRGFVTEIATEANSQFTRSELDSFLSRYIYNKQQQTSTQAVVFSIYNEDSTLDLQLERRIRAIPPSEKPLTLPVVPDKPGLKRILQALDEKIFTQGVFKSFKAYKLFDHDNDGYISLDDLTKGLETLNIPHSPSEAADLMGLMDCDNKGYVEFHEFAQVVKPDTVYQNSLKLGETQLKYPNYVQPCKEFLDVQLARAPAVNQSYEQLRTKYKPLDLNFSLKPCTRFGATPGHKNTFTSFVPAEQAGMYLGAKGRFNAKNKDPINIGSLDRDAKLLIQEAKSIRIRESLGKLQERITLQDEKLDQLDEAKVSHRAAFREEYEKHCHIYAAP